MKNIRKTIFFFLIILIIVFSLLISLSKNKSETTENINITSTVFPYYSLANDLCSANANNLMLLKPGTESHTFEPTTQDIISIKNSDIFIYTGGESDKWVETILSTINTDKIKIIRLMDYIDPITNEHHDHITYDEHIWTSPKNAKKIVQIICDALCEVNPRQADLFKNNLNNILKELNDLDKQFEETINSSDKTVIFADRFPFSYFAKDYGLNYISAFSSCAEESEPTVQAMKNIINTINKQNTKYVFYIEFSNQKIADTISKETGTSKLLFHSCHNVTYEDFENNVSYICLIKNNLKNLKEAIK